MSSKKIFFCVRMHKMVDIGKETYHKQQHRNKSRWYWYVIWLNEKHIEEKLGHKMYLSSQRNMTQYIESTGMN